MVVEWFDMTLGEFVRLQRGHDLTEAERRPGSVPIMGSAGPHGFHDIAKARSPGVVIGRSGVGSMGVVSYCAADYWPHNTVLYVTDFLGNNERFTYYLLKHLNLRRFDSGSAQASLNRNFIYPIRVRVPDRRQQQAIANVLVAFDEKINLNRRMNETLEAMARAIFKDWFVDFGPTRAKMKGRPPYLAPEIWTLFPDLLGNAGKPEGWRDKPLDQIAEFLNGLALQKYPASGEAYLPVIKIAQLRAGHTAGADRASTSVPPAYVVDNGDVLFSWSGSLLHRVWTGGRGALNQHLFKVTSAEYPKWFFFHWIAHHMPDFQATAAGKATTMGHIQRHHLARAITIVPSQDLMRVGQECIGRLLELVIANDLQSETLAATRDLLLPKLMSGEVRVREAERLAEAAA